MMSNWQVRRLISFPNQFRKRGAWGVALLLLGLFLCTSAHAAVFTVNNTTDVVDAKPGDGVCDIAPPSNVCTLRAAIMEANHATGKPHTVSIPSGTYTLRIPSLGTDIETAGALKIAASMNIIGAGSSTTVIDANGSLTNDRGFRILDVTANIEGVTIRNGAVSKGGGDFKYIGGGIDNEGKLTLTNTTVRDNSAGFGGGISNNAFGTLVLINSTVAGNKAVGSALGGLIGHSGGITNDGVRRLCFRYTR